MFRYIILIFVFLLISCENKNNEINEFKTSIFNIENNIPVITVKLNNKKVNLIIDTGSELSIIDEKYYKKNNDFNVIDSTMININTLNGEQINKVYIINGIVNDSINIKLYTMDISNVINDMFIKQQIFIDGIIGVDFLYENNLIIDFKNKTLSNL